MQFFLQEHYNLEEFKDVPYFGLFVGTVPFLIIRDPEFLKETFVKNFSHFADRDPIFNLKNDPINEHMFNVGGWQWRVLRSNLSPMFTSGKLKWMFESFTHCADNVEKYLMTQENNIVELSELAAKFTTDAIASTVLGIETNTLLEENNKFRNYAHQIFNTSWMRVLQNVVYFLSPALFEMLGMRFVPKEISDDFIKIVNDAIEYRTKNNVVRNDMIQLLMELQQQGPLEEKEDYKTAMDVQTNEKGQQVFELNNTRIAAQVYIFFVGGFETSSSTASFALYEMGCNPEMQERLAQEIDDVMEKYGDGPITYAALQDMKYLDMIVMETLRHYPVAGLTNRRVSLPYHVQGTNTTFPSKLRIFTPVYAIQHDPKYFPDPFKFDPERFSPENKKNFYQAAYIPFGVGPRNCIGARYGVIEVKLILATILRKFRLTPCEKTTIPARINPRSYFITMEGQTYFRVTLR